MTTQNLGGQAVVAYLKAYGVDTVFGIPGVHTLDLYRGLAEFGIRHIGVRHEQSARFMADGYARASGIMGDTPSSGPSGTGLLLAAPLSARAEVGPDPTRRSARTKLSITRALPSC